MSLKKVKYINGHFYDIESKKRIELKDGIELLIDTDERNYNVIKPAGHKPKKILTSQEKKMQVESDKKVKKSKKIFSAGKILYFHIQKNDVWFKAELLEDLYIFLNYKTKKKEGKLYECACVVTASLENRIKFFEIVYAASLNELFKSTFVHYYGNFGNPACNALERFIEDHSKKDSNLMKHRFF